ncbi:MAG: T9SS type A sorting domain-containing protein [Luteibaculaceae bacterium]
MQALKLLSFFALSLATLLPNALSGQKLGDTNFILKDKTPNLVNWELLSNPPEGYHINSTAWRQLYHEFSLASENLMLPKAKTLFKSTNSGVLDILLLNLEYGALVEGTPAKDSIKAGNFNETFTENDLVYSTIFAAAINQSIIHTNKSIKIRLLSEHIFGNVNTNNATYEIDFGTGFRALPINQEIEIDLEAFGSAVIKIRRVIANSAAESAFILTKRPARDGGPDATWIVDASLAHNDSIASGEVYVVYGSGNTSLTNPVIIIEGFDFVNSTNFQELFFLVNQQNVAQDLLDGGYDLVFLNYDNATEPIQRNGLLAATVLEMVADSIGENATSALVGVSMGGLVSRYALLHMEDMNIEHKVRNFISLDSPQLGAVIPLGLQHMFSSPTLGAALAEIEFLTAALNSESAQQMLLYHHTGTEGPASAGTQAFAANPSVLRTAFLADLTELGNWPLQPRLSSIINGTSTGVGQNFPIGDTLISFSASVPLLGSISGLTRSIPNQTAQIIWNLGSPPPLPFLPGIIIERRRVNNTRAEENAPGAPLALLEGFDDISFEGGSLFVKNVNTCFIPSVSAAGITTTDYFTNFSNQDLSTTTPFDAVYAPTNNEGHVEVTAQNAVWLITEITFGMEPLSVFTLNATAQPVKVFPNPTIDFLTIEMPKLATAQLVEIYNSEGKLIKTYTNPNQQSQLQINVEPFAQGVYVVRIISGNQVFQGRFIKQ